MFRLFVLSVVLFLIVLEKAVASIEFDEVFNGYSEDKDIELVSFFSAGEELDKGFIFLLTKTSSIGRLKNNYVVELKKISILGRNEISIQVYPEGVRLRKLSIMAHKKYLYLLAQISDKKLELLKYDQNKMELIERKNIELPRNVIFIENAMLSEKLEIYAVTKSIDELTLLRINSDGRVKANEAITVKEGKVISILGMRLYDDSLFLSGVLYKNENNFGWFAELDKKGKLLHSNTVGGQKTQLIPSLKSKIIINEIDDKARVMQFFELIDSNEKMENSLALIEYGQYAPEILHICEAKYIVMNKIKFPNKKPRLFALLTGHSKNGLKLSNSNNLIEVGNKVYRSYKFLNVKQSIFVGLTAIKLDDMNRLRVSIEVLKLRQVPDCR